jgi:hypothetical protein
MRGELPSQKQVKCNGSSRCSSVCRLARIEWNNRGQPETPARRSGRVISLRRLAFFQPIAVLDAARYCGAANTYSLLSPKISNASSRIGGSSGKIEQLRMPASFVMFDLWLRDTHPIQFPIYVVPAKRQRFRGCPKPTVAAQVQDNLPNSLDLGLDQASGHLGLAQFEPSASVRQSWAIAVSHHDNCDLPCL